MSLRSASQSKPAVHVAERLIEARCPARKLNAVPAEHRGSSDEEGSQSVGAAVSGGGRAVAARPLKIVVLAPGRAARAAPRQAQGVMLNPSIERTSPGKPGAASHVKR
jgi:hypothetical protein